jgi:hypothetical protein
MIDTIKFSPTNLEVIREDSLGWQFSTRTKPGGLSPAGIRYGESKCQILNDLMTGARIVATNSRIVCVEASLPRVLFGHNGKLIQSQFDIEAALAKLDSRIEEITCRPLCGRIFSRIDLVWQFEGDAQSFLIAHKNCLLPGIRKVPSIYPSESLFWRGSQLKCRMYDKSKQQTGKPGSVVRVEFQLQGQKLKKEFNGNLLPVSSLNFDQSYAVYRRLVLGFCPNISIKPCKVAEFLKIGLLAGWQYEGADCFELWTRGMSRQRRNQLSREIASARPEIFKIDWQSILPNDAPPAAVEIADTRYEANLQSASKDLIVLAE